MTEINTFFNLKVKFIKLTSSSCVNMYAILSFLIGIYSIILFIFAPRSIARTICSFLPNAGGVNDADFWGFGRRDAEYRLWYEKIASNHRLFGPRGYVWDDAFGIADSNRFYYAYGTYALLNYLGSRRMSAVSYVLFIGAVGLTLWDWPSPIWAAAAVLAVAGSPVAINSNTLLWKPEMFWFGPLLVAAHLGFSESVLIGALLWSFIVVANFAGPAIFVLCGGGALAAAAVETSQLMELLIGASPGALFTAYRLNLFKTLTSSRQTFGLLRSWSGRFSRNLSVSLTGDPNKAKIFSLTNIDDLLTTLPLGAACAVIALTTDIVFPAILLGTCSIFIYYANCRFLLIDDEQCYDVLFLSFGIALAITSESGWALGLVLMGAYRLRDPLHGCPAVEGLLKEIHRELIALGHQNGPRRWKIVLDKALERLDRFPEIGAVAKPKSPPLIAFFNKVKPASRILLESHSHDQVRGLPVPESHAKTFWEWSETILPVRKIEVVSEWNMFLLERAFSARYLRNVNVPALTVEKISDLCVATGASQIICYSTPTFRALTAAGWRLEATLDYANGVAAEERIHLNLGTPILALLSCVNDDIAIVTPPTPWSRDGNVLTMHVEADVTYQIRYRYHPNFKANINGIPITIDVYQPFEDVDLRFMTIKAPLSGSLTLWFCSGLVDSWRLSRIVASKPTESKS